MGVVLTVLDKLMIMFFLLIIGFICRKTKAISDGFFDGVAGFLTKVVIPCFVISSLQIEYTEELLHGGLLVFFTCVAFHFVALGIGYISAKILPLPKNARGIWIFSCMFANIGFMGVPVISLVFGAESLFYCAFASFGFNLTAYTLGAVVLNRCSQKEDKPKIDLIALFKAPVNSISIIGLILFLLRIQLPESLVTTTTMIGDMLAPLAMIYVGSVLGKLNVKEALTEKWAYAISVFRLLLIPYFAYLLLRNFIDNTLILGVIIIGLSTPVGALCAILAAEYDEDVELASKYIFVTTVLCIFTMPIFFLLFL